MTQKFDEKLEKIWSNLITEAENRNLFQLIENDNLKAICTTCADIWLLEKQPKKSWYKKSSGVLFFVSDFNNIHYFRLYYQNKKEWEIKITLPFDYTKICQNFHSFDSEEATVGFSFIDEPEADKFYENVIKSIENYYNVKKSRETNPLVQENRSNEKGNTLTSATKEYLDTLSVESKDLAKKAYEKLTNNYLKPYSEKLIEKIPEKESRKLLDLKDFVQKKLQKSSEKLKQQKNELNNNQHLISSIYPKLPEQNEIQKSVSDYTKSTKSLSSPIDLLVDATAPPRSPGHLRKTSSLTNFFVSNENIPGIAQTHPSIRPHLIRKQNKSPDDSVNLIDFDQTAIVKELTLENKFLKDQRLCIICFEKEKNIIFLPCRHFSTCESCSLLLKECPSCRKTIQSVEKFFF